VQGICGVFFWGTKGLELFERDGGILKFKGRGNLRWGRGEESCLGSKYHPSDIFTKTYSQLKNIFCNFHLFYLFIFFSMLLLT
jgi:hypothetical protein